MASEIKVDTIVNAGGDNDTGIDLATNDQILLKVANATKLTMNSTGQTTIVGEGGTTTTSLQNGLVKAWMKLNGTGTAAITDDFNFSSINDENTGQYQLIFTNNMANSTYAISVHDNNFGNGWADSEGTSGFDIRRRNESAAYADSSSIWVIVAGDLA
mgnify:CR=1 FL=1